MNKFLKQISTLSPLFFSLIYNSLKSSKRINFINRISLCIAVVFQSFSATTNERKSTTCAGLQWQSKLSRSAADKRYSCDGFSLLLIFVFFFALLSRHIQVSDLFAMISVVLFNYSCCSFHRYETLSRWCLLA